MSTNAETPLSGSGSGITTNFDKVKHDPFNSPAWEKLKVQTRPFLSTCARNAHVPRQCVNQLIEDFWSDLCLATIKGGGVDPKKNTWKAYVSSAVHHAARKLQAERKRNLSGGVDVDGLADNISIDVDGLADNISAGLAEEEIGRNVDLMIKLKSRVQARMNGNTKGRYDILAAVIADDLTYDEARKLLKIKEIGTLYQAVYRLNILIREEGAKLGLEL